MAKYIKETVRKRIIHEALNVFDNMDFHEATVRDIAQRASISPASLYKHFGSKEALVDTICVEKVKQMSIELRDPLGEVQGTLNKLRKMTWYYFCFYEQNPRVAWVLHISKSLKNWHASPNAWGTVYDTGCLLRNILQEGQNLGQIRQDLNIRLAVSTYFGGLNQIVQIWLVRGQPYSIISLVDDFTEVFFKGVQACEEQAVPFTCPYLEALKDSASSREKAQADIKAT